MRGMGDHWWARLADPPGTTVRARAIVDATGRAARIARSQGARRRRLDRLVAAYWMLAARGEPDRDCTTLVEAVAEGWWYTTPVPGARRVVAFLTDSDLLPGRHARTARDWRERVVRAPHISETLAGQGCPLHGNPLIVDAGVAHLEQPAGGAWVAAGDAAVSFDPLSSQGILTALLMGHAAGHAVAAMLTDRDQQPLIRVGRGVRAPAREPPAAACGELRHGATLAKLAVLGAPARRSARLVKCWVSTISRDHVQRGVEGGFTQAGHGKASGLRRLGVGDWLAFYSPKTSLREGEPLQAFTAIGRVADDEPVSGRDGARVRALAPQHRVLAVRRGADPAIDRGAHAFIKDKAAVGLRLPVWLVRDPVPRLRGDQARDGRGRRRRLTRTGATAV